MNDGIRSTGTGIRGFRFGRIDSEIRHSASFFGPNASKHVRGSRQRIACPLLRCIPTFLCVYYGCDSDDAEVLGPPRCQCE